jgi:hypothetical protein
MLKSILSFNSFTTLLSLFYFALPPSPLLFLAFFIFLHFLNFIFLIPFSYTFLLEFPTRDVTYLVGTEDTCNCKLKWYPGCCDNDLATYCPAMLQGNNRLDRILNWKMYLEKMYGTDNVHNVVFAEGVVHDPVQMLKSLKGKCVIFNVCQKAVNFPDHSHDGDPGQINSGGQKSHFPGVYHSNSSERREYFLRENDRN